MKKLVAYSRFRQSAVGDWQDQMLIKIPTEGLKQQKLVFLARILATGIVLLTLSACDVLRESSTDSGISGNGVAAKSIQTEIGDGSPLAWKSSTCVVVESRTQWKWLPAPKDEEAEGEDADPYIFHIDIAGEWQSKHKVGDVLITLLPLSNCKIDNSTKIAYTTKNWLCVDDYVKVDGADCLIKAIKEL